MVKIIEDVLEVYDFACEMSTSETRRYPSCDSKLRIWQLIQKGLENEHDFVLAVLEGCVSGCFCFLSRTG